MKRTVDDRVEVDGGGSGVPRDVTPPGGLPGRVVTSSVTIYRRGRRRPSAAVQPMSWAAAAAAAGARDAGAPSSGG